MERRFNSKKNMETIINGITYFQNGITLQKNHKRQRVLFDENMKRSFQKNNIFTYFLKTDSRFKVNKDFIEVGENAVIEPYTIFPIGNRFYSMGAFSYCRSVLPINTIIGRYSSIATNVNRLQGSHPLTRFTTSNVTYVDNNIAYNQFLKDHDAQFSVVKRSDEDNLPIVIGNDVWVGQDVRFGSRGITIGDGAVIAAGTLVTKDVPPYAVVAGVPGRIIKFRFESHIIQKLLNLKWWQYAYKDFNEIKGDVEIEQFIDSIESMVYRGSLTAYQPKTLSLNDGLMHQND